MRIRDLRSTGGSGILHDGSVVFAIWNVLDNGGDRVRARVDRQPDARSEAATVGKRDPHVFDGAHIVHGSLHDVVI